MPMAPKFWGTGPSIWVARWRLPTSSRSWGKVPTIQVASSPPETDEELAQWLQKEKIAVEEAWLGRDAATLKVVI